MTDFTWKLIHKKDPLFVGYLFCSRNSHPSNLDDWMWLEVDEGKSTQGRILCGLAKPEDHVHPHVKMILHKFAENPICMCCGMPRVCDWHMV